MERRRSGVFQTNSNFMDRLIQKIEEEKDNPNTIYTGDFLIRTLNCTHSNKKIYFYKYLAEAYILDF